MSVVNPVGKGLSQLFCKVPVLLFSEISQIDSRPMRRKPVSGDCRGRIFFQLLHLPGKGISDDVKRPILIKGVHIPDMRNAVLRGRQGDHRVLSKALCHDPFCFLSQFFHILFPSCYKIVP